MAAVLAGVRRYQAAAPAAPRPERPIIARIGNASLRDHGGDIDGPILIMVPSLINPPSVLDLAPGNSLLDALAAAGFKVLLVDWGATETHGLSGAISDRLVPLVAGLGRPVLMAGYCLGGTLAVAAAALLGDRISRLALLATPWHFGGYGDPARAGLAQWWQNSAPMAERLGAMPIDLLQPAFWSLDGAGLADKYQAFAALPEGEAASAFVRLEDWSNSGEPLSLAAITDIALTLFAGDASGRGSWQIAGQRIDAAALTCPVLDVIASRDRIVPAASALSMTGPATALQVDAGHVGMIIGRRAPDLLWAPLGAWLRA